VCCFKCVADVSASGSSLLPLVCTWCTRTPHESLMRRGRGRQGFNSGGVYTACMRAGLGPPLDVACFVRRLLQGSWAVVRLGSRTHTARQRWIRHRCCCACTMLGI
jgi:hypothetical protein